MKHYPHRTRRNFCTLLIAALIASPILLACAKGKDYYVPEPPPADKSLKDSVYKWEGWGKGDKN